MSIPQSVQFFRIDKSLEAPRRAHPTDGAVDLRTSEDLSLAPGEQRAVPTGISIMVPVGYAGWVVPRSGLAAKHGISIVNAPGLVDSDYRGEVKVLLINLGKETVHLSRGERIAQMAIAPVLLAQWEETDTLDDTERGAGGFGSSGTL